MMKIIFRSVMVLIVLLFVSPAFSKCDLAKVAAKLDVAKVQKLIAAGNDVNCVHKKYGPPLHAAIIAGFSLVSSHDNSLKKAIKSSEIVNDLVESGADSSLKFSHKLWRMIPAQSFSALELLVGAHNIIGFNPVGENAAVKDMAYPIITLLADDGAPLNTAFLGTGSSGDIELALLFEKKGVDVFTELEGKNILDFVNEIKDLQKKFPTFRQETNNGRAAILARYRPMFEAKKKAAQEQVVRQQEQATRQISVQKKKERQQQIQKIIERDSRLPPQARIDKYLVALTSRLMDESYDEALLYFELIEQSSTELDRSFNYFYGEALLRTGQPEQALEKFYSYIELTGTNGQHYVDALNLINEAEEKL